MAWIRPSASIEIQRPAREIFDYYLTARAWAPGPRFPELTAPTERRLGVGDRFDGTYRQGRQQVATTFEMIDIEHQRRIVVDAKIGQIRQETTVEFEPLGPGATALKMTIRTRGSRPAILSPSASIFLPMLIKWGIGRTLRGEKARIESAVA